MEHEMMRRQLQAKNSLVQSNNAQRFDHIPYQIRNFHNS